MAQVTGWRFNSLKIIRFPTPVYMPRFGNNAATAIFNLHGGHRSQATTHRNPSRPENNNYDITSNTKLRFALVFIILLLIVAVGVGIGLLRKSAEVGIAAAALLATLVSTGVSLILVGSRQGSGGNGNGGAYFV